MEKENKLTNGMKHLLVMVGVAVLLMFAGILHVDAAPVKNDSTQSYYLEYWYDSGSRVDYQKQSFNTDVRMAVYKKEGYYGVYVYDVNGGNSVQIRKEVTSYYLEYYNSLSDDKPYYTKDYADECPYVQNNASYGNLYYRLNNDGVNPVMFDVKTNIPIFTDTDSMVNYFETGYIEPEEVYDESFSLLGFNCDNSINATWTGFKTSNWVDATQIKVNVEPRYFIILEQGEEEQDFDVPETESVNYSEYKYYKNYDDFYINNPYKGRSELILYFYPTYYDAETNILYKGKSIAITVDKSGNIDDVHIPEVSLTATYDDNFYLKDFIAKSEFHNWSDCFIHTYWLGSTIDNEIDYVYSDLKVQLYARQGAIGESTYKWIDYEHNDIVSIRDNGMSFNLTELDDYCRSKGFRFYDSTYQWKDEKIRITPYYKTSDSYHYGRSVEITLTQLAGIKSVLQSKGDAFDSENPPGYEDLQEEYTDDEFWDDVYDDLVDGENGEFDINNVTSNFFTIMWDLFKACGQFPKLVGDVLSFLPNVFVNMLLGVLSVVLILRLLGR